jgi:predicted dehydrogenase
MSHARTSTFLVVGAGSIGMRHLRNLRSLGAERLAVCEPDEERRAAATNEGARGYTTLEEAVESFRPTAGLVCTPPAAHVSAALTLVRAGADVFIEKPLAAELSGVDELLSASETSGRIVQVGYNLRFHPVLTTVKALLDQGRVGKVLHLEARFGQYLPDWRPKIDYRRNYTARRDLGGGILLDASHEIDYVTWLLGAPETVTCASGKASSLEVDVEDNATLLLGYQRGVHAVVHVDFVRRGYLRTLDVLGESGNVQADLGARSVRLEHPPAAGESLPIPEGDMYRAELAHFLECITKRQPPQVGLREGKRTLEIVVRAKESALDGQRKRLS